MASLCNFVVDHLGLLRSTSLAINHYLHATILLSGIKEWDPDRWLQHVI